MLKMPLQKLNKDNKTALLFLILVILELITTIIFVLPVINSLPIEIFYGFTHISMGVTFLLSYGISPGYLEPHPKYDFQDLINKIDPVFLCPD
jgi:hypothetical protein